MLPDTLGMLPRQLSDKHGGKHFGVSCFWLLLKGISCCLLVSIPIGTDDPCYPPVSVYINVDNPPFIMDLCRFNRSFCGHPVSTSFLRWCLLHPLTRRAQFFPDWWGMFSLHIHIIVHLHIIIHIHIHIHRPTYTYTYTYTYAYIGLHTHTHTHTHT